MRDGDKYQKNVKKNIEIIRNCEAINPEAGSGISKLWGLAAQ